MRELCNEEEAGGPLAATNEPILAKLAPTLQYLVGTEPGGLEFRLWSASATLNR